MNSLCALVALLSWAASAAAQPAPDLYRAGRGAFARGQFDSAATAFERAIALSDSSPAYHIWLARTLGKQAEHASAFRVPFIARRFRREWERAVALAPNDVDAREGMLEVYLGPHMFGGDAAKARREADVIFQLDPLRGYIARFHVDAHGSDADRLSRVEADARAAVAAFPDSVAAANLLVDVLLPARADEAIALVESLAIRRPNDYQALYSFGRVCALTGKEPTRGEESLRRVLAARTTTPDSMLPPLANIRLRLGNVLERQGRGAEARLEFAAALELDPTLDEARAGLNRLPPLDDEGPTVAHKPRAGDEHWRARRLSTPTSP